MALSAAEQYFLELTNRARLDPRAEARRQDVNINEGLPGGTLSGRAKDPLAPNGKLHKSSDDHSDWMLRTDQFQHSGAGGSSAGDRMAEAGYAFTRNWAWAENLALHTVDGRSGERLADIHHQGLWESSVHRQNLLSDNYREIGIAEVVGRFDFGGGDRETSVITNNFARNADRVFVTGVVYRDTDDDDFYSVGEAERGVIFSSQGRDVSTAKAGGYALRVDPDGNARVDIDGRGIDMTVRVEIDDANAKLDVVDRSWLYTSADLTLQSGVRKAAALGSGGVDITGKRGGDVLIGNSGRNELDGRGGTDRLVGGGGRDDLDGGRGRDKLIGNGGRDDLDGGLGHDVLRGGRGSDDLEGGRGRDRLIGNGGRDELDGGAARDVLKGGRGSDELDGGRGRDTLMGNGGRDTLEGGGQRDVLKGGAGADRLLGEGGVDVLIGGAGADRYIHDGGPKDRHDIVRGFDEGRDLLVFRGEVEGRRDFDVEFRETHGRSDVADAHIRHEPTDRLVWIVQDAETFDDIDIRTGGDTFDILG